MNILYFDQRLGAALSKSWLKYDFSTFFYEKAEKIGDKLRVINMTEWRWPNECDQIMTMTNLNNSLQLCNVTSVIILSYNTVFYYSVSIYLSIKKGWSKLNQTGILFHRSWKRVVNLSCYIFRRQWLNILSCPPSKVLFTFLMRYYLGLTESSGFWLSLFLVSCLFTFQFSPTIIGRLVTSFLKPFFWGLFRTYEGFFLGVF